MFPEGSGFICIPWSKVSELPGVRGKHHTQLPQRRGGAGEKPTYLPVELKSQYPHKQEELFTVTFLV